MSLEEPEVRREHDEIFARLNSTLEMLRSKHGLARCENSAELLAGYEPDPVRAMIGIARRIHMLAAGL